MSTCNAFVIVGLQPWYTDIGSNCKHIARTLAKGNKVLYINSSLDRRSVLESSKNPGIQKHIALVKEGKGHLNQVADNLWEYYPRRILESINWLPSTWLFRRLNYLNNKRFAADIREAVQQLNMQEYHLFNDNEIFRAFHLKLLLHPRAYIYYCRDYLLGVDYWKKHGTELEPEHIRNADLAFANSAYLADYLKQYNPRSFDIGQGCDTGMFNGRLNREEPDDILRIPGIKVGYVGALNSLRLDIACLQKIADGRPDWQLILVGPEDEAFKDSGLHSRSNVHFLGHRSLEQLPAYIQSFDICLNPQLLNEVTIGNYPLKIDEYLNMGKPVVATKTSTMDMFKPYACLAEDNDDYIPLIAKALEEDSERKREERMDFAAGHTWENSVKKMLEALNI